ncbi:MAG: hypothetical protein M9890_05845 [Thermomicrobiales bacterium]|nr:hypothetical protein [Thermomicrobiales bacterium]
MALATLLTAACGSNTPGNQSAPAPSIPTGSSAGSTQTSAAATTEPTFTQNEPLTIDISSQEDPPTDPAMLVSFSELVISGIVTDFLPPMWTTPDGVRPENVLDRAANPGTILTPVVIELDADPYLDVTNQFDGSHSVVIFVEGGTLDGVTIQHNGRYFHYESGDHVVVGLIPIDSPFPVAAYGRAFTSMIPDGFSTAWLPTARYVLGGGLAKNGPIVLNRDEFFAQLDSAITDRTLNP